MSFTMRPTGSNARAVAECEPVGYLPRLQQHRLPGFESAIVTGSDCSQPITWDVRNDILDTTDIMYMPSGLLESDVTWDYNDDCGSRARAQSLCGSA